MAKLKVSFFVLFVLPIMLSAQIATGGKAKAKSTNSPKTWIFKVNYMNPEMQKKSTTKNLCFEIAYSQLSKVDTTMIKNTAWFYYTVVVDSNKNKATINLYDFAHRIYEINADVKPFNKDTKINQYVKVEFLPEPLLCLGDIENGDIFDNKKDFVPSALTVIRRHKNSITIYEVSSWSLNAVANGKLYIEEGNGAVLSKSAQNIIGNAGKGNKVFIDCKYSYGDPNYKANRVATMTFKIK